jgi:hypothetical protein
MDIKRPDVQESFGENPHPRRDEGPVGIFVRILALATSSVVVGVLVANSVP